MHLGPTISGSFVRVFLLKAGLLEPNPGAVAVGSAARLAIGNACELGGDTASAGDGRSADAIEVSARYVFLQRDESSVANSTGFCV